MDSDEEQIETVKEESHVEPQLTIVQAVGIAILVILLQFLLAQIFYLTGVPFLASNNWLLLAIFQLISGFIAAQAGCILSGIRIVDLFTRNRTQFLLLLPLTVASCGILILASELGNILNAIQAVPNDYVEGINDLFSQSFWGVLFTIAILAPIIEELVFRGVILEGLQIKYSRKTAVLISSLLFAAVHLYPWHAIVNAFFLALFLSWVMLKTRSLVLCIVAHALFNGLNLVLSKFIQLPIPGFNNMSTDLVQHQPLWFDALGVVLLLLGIGGLRALYEPSAPEFVEEPTSVVSSEA
jgi:membrane protease YdiL (CAAX protease family)